MFRLSQGGLTCAARGGQPYMDALPSAQGRLKPPSRLCCVMGRFPRGDVAPLSTSWEVTVEREIPCLISRARVWCRCSIGKCPRLIGAILN